LYKDSFQGTLLSLYYAHTTLIIEISFSKEPFSCWNVKTFTRNRANIQYKHMVRTIRPRNLRFEKIVSRIMYRELFKLKKNTWSILTPEVTYLSREFIFSSHYTEKLSVNLSTVYDNIICQCKMYRNNRAKTNKNYSKERREASRENGFFRESFLVTRDVDVVPKENLSCHSSYS
jgi:hypothetical protein